MKQNASTTDGNIVTVLRDKVNLECVMNQTYSVQGSNSLTRQTLSDSAPVLFSNAPTMTIFNEANNVVTSLIIGEIVTVKITTDENTFDSLSIKDCRVDSGDVSIPIIENGSVVPMFGKSVIIGDHASFNLTVFQIGNLPNGKCFNKIVNKRFQANIFCDLTIR